MELTIKGEPKEIAALALAIQELRPAIDYDEAARYFAESLSKTMEAANSAATEIHTMKEDTNGDNTALRVL